MLLTTVSYNKQKHQYQAHETELNNAAMRRPAVTILSLHSFKHNVQCIAGMSSVSHKPGRVVMHL